MRKWTCAAAVAILMEVVFSSRARAQENWAQEHPVIIAGFAFGELAANLYFTSFAIRAEPMPSSWSASAELVLTLPQVAGLLWIGIGNPTHIAYPDRLLLIMASAWPASLSAHAIWSLAQKGVPPPPVHRAATWGPTFVSDGFRIAPGLGISGAF